MRKRSSTSRDEGAFVVLYERHRAVVLAVCMGVLGSRQDAEDAAQEAFAALAVALRVDPPRDTRAWLVQVARNAAIDLIRQRRHTEYTDDQLPDRAAAFDGAPAELQSVLQGIRELPEAQRTALLMRELAGHSYREIASLLETEEHAVRGLIARARIGLRDHREASELPCAAARQAIAAEPNRRPRDRTVRRHVRSCGACRAYMQDLRDDAHALRGLLPLSGGGIAGGGALVGGLSAKGAILGGVLSQVGTGCAVSVCAVGGVILIAPRGKVHHRARSPARVAAPARPRHATAPSALPASASFPAASSRAAVTSRTGTAGSPVALTTARPSEHRTALAHDTIARGSDLQARPPTVGAGRSPAGPSSPHDVSSPRPMPAARGARHEQSAGPADLKAGSGAPGPAPAAAAAAAPSDTAPGMDSARATATPAPAPSQPQSLPPSGSGRGSGPPPARRS